MNARDNTRTRHASIIFLDRLLGIWYGVWTILYGIVFDIFAPWAEIYQWQVWVGDGFGRFCHRQVINISVHTMMLVMVPSRQSRQHKLCNITSSSISLQPKQNFSRNPKFTLVLELFGFSKLYRKLLHNLYTLSNKTKILIIKMYDFSIRIYTDVQYRTIEFMFSHQATLPELNDILYSK